ncbi:MAG: hypothetical protein QM767_01955 [Anaeromyxobacter sp.]
MGNKLRELEKWSETKNSPLGLPKVGHRKAAVVKAEKKVEGDAAAVAGAAPGRQGRRRQSRPRGQGCSGRQGRPRWQGGPRRQGRPGRQEEVIPLKAG